MFRIIPNRLPKRRPPRKRCKVGSGVKGRSALSTGPFFAMAFGNLLGPGYPVRLVSHRTFSALGTKTVMKSAWLKLLMMLMLVSICAFGAGSHQWSVLGPDGRRAQPELRSARPESRFPR